MDTNEIWLTIILPLLLAQVCMYIKSFYDNHMTHKNERLKFIFDEKVVNLKKNNFIGKTSLQKRFKDGPKQKLVCLSINCTHAPAHGGASLMEDDKVIGTITSGEWGHRVGLNLAYAFVNPEKSKPGNKMTLNLLGEMISVKVIPFGVYDRSYSRILV